MTQNEILEIALRQSAVDMNCKPEDFLADKNMIFISAENSGARKYLKLPFLCNFVSYGSSIVASATEKFAGIAEDHIRKFPDHRAFETPGIHNLIEKIKPFGANICFMAEYWLPDLSRLKPLKCGFETRVFTDFSELYLPEWSNALCAERKELDILGVGAFDGERLVGLAGCSADCEEMWQIGVDVLPGYRKNGIASALTSTLACESLARGKVPFYCCAWSNVRSAKNAVKSGFSPAWIEMTIREQGYIDKLRSKEK